MATASKGKRAQSAAPRRGGNKAPLKLMLGLLALPIMAVLLPTCLVLGACMLPTALAFLFDRYRERYLVLSVAMLNFCGALPAVADLWARGQSLSGAVETLADPLSWLMAYGAGGVGWLLHAGMPPIVSVYNEQLTKTRVRQLALQQKSLVETWGEEVKQEAKSEALAAEQSLTESERAPKKPAEIDPASVLGL